MGKWTDCLRNLENAARYDPRNRDVLGDLMFTHLYLRRYREAADWAERCLAQSPDDAWTAFGKVELSLLADGDMEKAKILADSIPLRNYTPGVSMWSIDATTMGILDNFRQLVLARMSCETPADSLTRYLASIVPFHSASENPAEHRRRVACADSARAIVVRYLQDLPDDPGFHGLLGLTLAVAGKSDSAIQEGEKAVRMLPLSKDVLDGSQLIGNLAVIYVLAGKHDAAIDQLDRLLSIPSELSVALLGVDPTWTPLRSNPRFQKLLEQPDKVF